MAQTESPFVIGVIREKEKTFLQPDEYTRMIEASDATASERSLVDTVYGTYLEREGSSSAALQGHLLTEWKWLLEVVDDPKILLFLGARYDALNIAGMLLDKVAGRESLRSWSELGTLPDQVVASLLREGDLPDWEVVPNVWRSFLKEEVATTKKDDWSAGEMLVRLKEQVLGVWEWCAHTPLTKELTGLWAEHLQFDEAWRQEAGDVSGGEVVQPTFLSEKVVSSLRNEEDGSAYEQEWDAHVMNVIRPSKNVPVGSDPIVAWWLAKELEVKSIRLVLAGKNSGMSTEALRGLIRPLYLVST